MKDYSALDELVPKTEELHRAIFDKGYEQGLEDAWEYARKIILDTDCGGLPVAVLFDIFDCNAYGVMHKCSASEAIEKIKTWEQKEE